MQPPDTTTEIERALDRGPSQTKRRRLRAQALLRQLSEREPTDLPLISAYLDLRRPGDAADPAVREARIVVRDRLGQIEASVAKHGPARDSFMADSERISGLLEGMAGQRGRGLAAFACHGEGLFETLLAWAPFEPRVEAGPQPFLVPLARLVDHEPTLVALAAANEVRLFVSQPDRLEELPAIGDESHDYQRPEGIKSQHEHHIDEHRRDFARRAAELVAGTMAMEDAERLVLAGPDDAVSDLRDNLPKAAAERVRARIHVAKWSHGEVEAGILPTIRELEAEDATDAADRLLGAASSDGLGVAGLEPTRRALEAGQGLELIIVDGGPLPEPQVNDLVRLATLGATRITFVEDHAGLRDLDGVGVLLRYRV